MGPIMLFALLLVFMHNCGNAKASLGSFGEEFVAVDNCSRAYMDILHNKLGCTGDSFHFCTFSENAEQGNSHIFRLQYYNIQCGASTLSGYFLEYF